MEYFSSISHITDSVLENKYRAKGLPKQRVQEKHDVEDAVIAHPMNQTKVFTYFLRPKKQVILGFEIYLNSYYPI